MENLDPIIIDQNTLFRHHYTLPPLPAIVTRIQQSIHANDVDIKELVKLIGSDPSLVAQILKIINSAYYGIPREITELKFAVAYLGLNEIYRLVISLSVLNTLSIHDKEEIAKFWFHSYYTALCTKFLTKRFEPLLPMEEIWPAAILHDIGKLVYLKFYPKHYQALIKDSSENGCLFSESEIRLNLPASGLLGALLCDHWRLPNKIKKACESHTLRDLERIRSTNESDTFNRIICIGNLVAILATNALNQETRQKIAEAVKTKLNCTEEQFLVLMGEIYQIKVEVEQFRLF